jgi:hypothetical protein
MPPGLSVGCASPTVRRTVARNVWFFVAFVEKSAFCALLAPNLRNTPLPPQSPRRVARRPNRVRGMDLLLSILAVPGGSPTWGVAIRFTGQNAP